MEKSLGRFVRSKNDFVLGGITSSGENIILLTAGKLYRVLNEHFDDDFTQNRITVSDNINRTRAFFAHRFEEVSDLEAIIELMRAEYETI